MVVPNFLGFTGSMKCDPEAQKYKLKFKKNKDDLVSILFKLFNKEVFDNKVNKFNYNVLISNY